MINLKEGIVEEIVDKRNNAIETKVRINGKVEKAIAYRQLIGEIYPQNRVLLNTSANDLGLGTGGYHYVLANLDNPIAYNEGTGHIMKLRYTPLQIKVNSCEEQESQYHHIFNKFTSLDNMPIIIGGLHSMLIPLSLVLKELDSNIKVCYIMTDGGALPIDFSKNVYLLKKEKYLDFTITIGHAFGGDYECINIYNALIMAKEVLMCDICIVIMGPGIVGTGTKYGFTGIEQGHIIDAVNDLGGTPIFVPRISFKDTRSRHYGISHHTLTVLSEISKTRAKVGIPVLQEKRLNYINKQIEESSIANKHDIIYYEYTKTIDILKKSYLPMNTMGRDIKDDIEYFITVGINAEIALNHLSFPLCHKQ